MPKATPEKLLPPEVWRGLRQEWLWVYHGEPPNTLKWSAEILVPPGLFFVEHGCVRMRVNGTEIEIPQGHAFFSGPGLRRQWFDKKTRLLSTGLRCTWPDGSPVWKSGLNCTLPATKITALHRATRRLCRAVHPQTPRLTFRDATQAKARTLAEWATHEVAFQAWFVVYAEALSKLGITPEVRLKAGDRHLQRIVQWLDELPLDSATALPKGSPGMLLGPRRIEQLLNKHLGLTPRAYLERRRQEAARRMLLANNAALKEIACALGFRHASHFTAWFRRDAGMSPSAFRESGGGCAA